MGRITAAPHSDAYLTLNLEGSRALTYKETRLAEVFDQNLKAKKKAEQKSKPVFFKEKLTQAMLDSGKFNKEQANAVANDVSADSVPVQIRDLYFDVMDKALKARLAKDFNYS